MNFNEIIKELAEILRNSQSEQSIRNITAGLSVVATKLEHLGTPESLSMMNLCDMLIEEAHSGRLLPKKISILYMLLTKDTSGVTSPDTVTEYEKIKRLSEELRKIDEDINPM